jgi:cell division protein FtsB
MKVRYNGIGRDRKLSIRMTCTPDRIALFSHERAILWSNVAASADDRSTPSPAARSRGRRLLQYLLVFVTCVLVIDAIVGEKGLIAMIKARQQYEALEQSLDRARAENARLREEARRLREDPAAVEDIARRELGLMKPGEKLFIIRDIAPDAGRR